MKAFGITQNVVAVSGLTEWQKTTLTTSMSALCGRIHLLGEEMPKLTRDEGAVIDLPQRSGFCS
jgi:hypothetical protein